MLKDDEGYIVVETVGAFFPFVLLVASILCLVNIFALQARVHYALTQATNTLAMYSYALEVMGVADRLSTLDGKADNAAKKISAALTDLEAVLSGIDSLSGISGSRTDSAEAESRSFGFLEETTGEPQTALGLLKDYGIGELRAELLEYLVRPLVGRYLANGAVTADEYLRSVRVVKNGRTGLDALEFHGGSILGPQNSVLVDRNGDVKLIVHYEVEYSFGALPLPFRPTLRITQTAVTKAWLGGSGKGYW